MNARNWPVRECDRRTVAKICGWDDGLYVEWIATGDDTGDGVNLDVENKIAQAIANAVGEERVRAVREAMIGCSEGTKPFVARLANVSFREAVSWFGESDDTTDDDIRSLVLKGWGK